MANVKIKAKNLRDGDVIQLADDSVITVVICQAVYNGIRVFWDNLGMERHFLANQEFQLISRKSD